MISEKQLELLSDLLKVYVDMAIQNVREKQQKPAGFPTGGIIEKAGEELIGTVNTSPERMRYPNDFDKKVEFKLKDDIPTHLIDALKYSHLEFNKPKEITMQDLLELYFKNRPYNIPAFVDFAKLVRVLTIEETTAGISARMQKVQTEPNGGSYKPVPWVDERPKENIIKLPKDFTL